MSRVALIIFFNHPHEENIPVLEKIYGERFSDIYYLAPCYRGKRANAIPVYAHSHHFHHYFPQSLPKFFDAKYDHYLFISDDLILNPLINEKNYAEILHLDRNSCFFPRFQRLERRLEWNWTHARQAMCFNRRGDRFSLVHELPDCNEANRRFNRLGFGDWTPAMWSVFFCTGSRQAGGLKFGFRYSRPMLLKHPGPAWSHHRYLSFLWKVLGVRKMNVDYPLIGGFSDMFCVNVDTIKAFCHFCGIFACASLFTEVAVPTSLALCAKKIVRAKDIGMEIVLFWGELSSPVLDYKLKEKYKQDIQLLFDQFPEKLLFVHPIKLSEFATGRLRCIGSE